MPSGSDSNGSSRSLRSRGAAAASEPNNRTRRKQNALRTTWTQDETAELVHFLWGQQASAGDNNFKDETFNQAAAAINAKFLSQKVPKNSRSCSSKFANLKADYNIVTEIKSASGFHYDDEKGAIVDEATKDAWEGFCRSHPGASKFKYNSTTGAAVWPFWTEMVSLMPHDRAKEAHAYFPTQSRSRKRAGKKAATVTTTPGPSGPSESAPTTSTVTDVAINHSLPEDDVVMDDATPNPTGADPNFMKPSTPSTYLSQPSPSTSSAAVTSVSRGKRKASGVPDSISAASDNHKRSRPLSVTAQAQLDGSDAMRRLATALEAMLEERDQKPPTVTVPPPTTVTQAMAGPSNLNSTIVTQNSGIIDQAGDILVSLSLPPDQTNAISAYMQNPVNINNVRFFIKFNQESREFWIKEVLNEIWAARAKRAQIE